MPRVCQRIYYLNINFNEPNSMNEVLYSISFFFLYCWIFRGGIEFHLSQNMYVQSVNIEKRILKKWRIQVPHNLTP